MDVLEDKKLVRNKLKELFGYTQFRSNQEAIVECVLRRASSFVIMPTGAGKSLCYQLPAIMMEGFAIVISPLIALMKNQVDQMNIRGIEARFLNSTLSRSEVVRVKKKFINGELKLLYVAPESLGKEDYIEFFREANVSFVAVDEAHCISEWGHDFRPEYRKIKSTITQLGNMPIIALTATATPKVRRDIQKNLQMEEARVFVSSFNRKNLYYEVQPKHDPNKQLIQFLKDHKGRSGIVYCLSRKKVTEIAQMLLVNGFKAAPYHAGLDADVRTKNQDDFLNEDIDIVVATIAFGMGIDKPDVRFVVHYDVPKSIEGYYQETGRAGRDGLEGKCLMLYSPVDLSKMEKFNKDKAVQERENAKYLLQEVKFFAESPTCKRKQLMHYFGEDFNEENCGSCDNCLHPPKKYPAVDYATLSLEAVRQTEGRFELDHLVKVLCGVEDEYTKSYGHTKLPAYKKGSHKDANFWKSVIRQLLIYGYIKRDVNNTGILQLAEKGLKFLSDSHYIELAEDYDFTVIEHTSDTIGRSHIDTKAYDVKLYEMLKKLRKEIAKKKNLPPYIIFQELSLEEMATTYPTTDDELAAVNGVGMGKVKKFGSSFLEIIKTYVEENDIAVPSNVIVKSSVNKSKTKIFIIQQIDRKVDLEEIAKAKNISFEALLTEIENICYSGTKLNIDYYLNRAIDEGRQDCIYDCLLNSETDDIETILNDEDMADCSEEEIRMMRVKFLSECAN